MRVLIVGLGSIAKKHINALKQIDSNVIIYALRSNKNAEITNGIINIYNPNELYELNIDFVILSNPTALHYKYLTLLKDLKKPLFIEKPLFDNIGIEQENLVNSITKINVPTYVACNLRFLDSILKIKDLIKTERINEVNVYCGSYLPDWRPNIDYKTVYSANKEMGGGVHIDLIHELDYVYWLFGTPIETKSTFRNKSSLKISAYDYANYLWLYGDFAANITLNYYRKDSKRNLEVVCDSGTYSVDLLQNKIFYNNTVVFESNKKVSDTYDNQLVFFTENVIQYNDKFNSIDQAYKILELCLKD